MAEGSSGQVVVIVKEALMCAETASVVKASTFIDCPDA